MAAVKQSFPDITKSAEDDRNYRGLELKNGLKVAPELFWLKVKLVCFRCCSSLTQAQIKQQLLWMCTLVT